MCPSSEAAVSGCSSGVDPAAMAAFVQTLLRELPGLPLDARGQVASRAALKDMQRERGRADPDQGRISAALERFAGYLGKAGRCSPRC
jgi:hypothetical protein